MKKCANCAKEISYSEMYCCNECEKIANEYYSKRLKLRIPMNIIYIAGTAIFALGVFFVVIFNTISLFAIGGSCTVMGVATIILPSPPDGMIAKHKLQSAQKRIKLMGLALTVAGAAVLVYAVITLFI